MPYIPEKERAYFTKEELDSKMQNRRYPETLEHHAKVHGYLKCLDCPYCDYFVGRLEKDPYLGGAPHCMKMSPKGLQCSSKGNRSLGRPNKCPLVTEDERSQVKADKLKSVITNQKLVIEKAKATIAKAEAELGDEVPAKSAAEMKLDKIMALVVKYQNKERLYIVDAIYLLDFLEKILKEDE